jgi:hypothetical protein
MSKDLKKIHPFLIPFLLFFASFLLRLALISKGPYHMDCLNLAIQVERTLSTQKLQPLFGFGYPLTVLSGVFFFWLTKFWGHADPVFAVNLMSVVFGSLCIPTFYAFIKRILDERTAILSSIALSLSPLFLALATLA